MSEYLAACEAAGRATVDVAIRRVRVQDFAWHCAECETTLEQKAGHHWCPECRGRPGDARYAEYTPVGDAEAVLPKGPAAVTMDLPLPDRCLSPNARSHWRKKSGLVRSQRETAKTLARAVLGRSPAPRWPRATVQIIVCYADARARDKDNLQASLKSAFDGLEDAGLIENDAGLTCLPVEVLPPDPEAVGVRMILRRE